jgi:GST-like protein
MIDLYYWTTPNGHKVTMFLEEAGMPYNIIPCISARASSSSPSSRHRPQQPHPRHRRPAGRWRRALSLFESGAILQYLAEKSGQFLPADVRGRAEVMQWLFWQMGGLGPWQGRTTISCNTRPNRSTTPSRATSMKRTAIRRAEQAPGGP